MAGALLTLLFYRRGGDVVAGGFLVFTVGQALILSTAGMDLTASVPAFGAGVSLWAVALGLISIPRVFPIVVRLLGLLAAALFAAVGLRIFAGEEVLPTTSPLPFNAYPVLVATFVGWIWTLGRPGRLDGSPFSQEGHPNSRFIQILGVSGSPAGAPTLCSSAAEQPPSADPELEKPSEVFSVLLR